MKFIINSLISLCILGQVFLPVSYAQTEEVCISSERATDLIQILDVSDRNLQLLESCGALVDQLYAEIEIRDQIIEKLTKENIKLKQEINSLKKKRDREKYLRYAGIGAIVYAVIKVALVVGSI